MELFFKGLIIGLGIAAPVGPIGILCIQRSLLRGRLVGLVTGLGAATADLVYGIIAVTGLSLLSSVFLEHSRIIRGAGVLFLFFLGVRVLFTKRKPVEQGMSGLTGTFVSAFLLTLSNPVTILTFIGIFAGLGAVDTGSGDLQKMVLAAGVFAGSALWWVVLSSFAGIFGKKLTRERQLRINRISGLVLLGFAFWLGFGLVR